MLLSTLTILSRLEVSGHQVGLSKKRAGWLVDWLEDKSTLGKVRSSPRAGSSRLRCRHGAGWGKTLSRTATRLVASACYSADDAEGALPLARRAASRRRETADTRTASRQMGCFEL